MDTGAALSNGVVAQRQQALQKFSDVIDSASKNLDGILKEIGWSIEDLQTKEAEMVCPLNPNHRVIESSLEGHIERCKWARDGYTKEEKDHAASLEANSFFYENKKNVHTVELDMSSQREIMSRFAGPSDRTFPRTMDRLDVEFSPDERLAIYEKVREKSQIQTQADIDDLEINLETDKKDEEDKKEKVKTHSEVLAEMRDYRRRRQSYRAKNVHITKKTRTDIIREIIESNMKFFEDSPSAVKKKRKLSKKKRKTKNMKELTRDLERVVPPEIQGIITDVADHGAGIEAEEEIGPDHKAKKANHTVISIVVIVNISIKVDIDHHLWKIMIDQL
ncbi:LOW QUALITY PROTEIN: U11/U12 small nuclear ribonucleoprotein 48 kDa protein-like [Lytechinus pictus]|uniref:LOW QUALITY PROTEIN: U11/U12 small nuclear ribonucleoprotein 48 kDa protein-like n=1 Tax=Lytechinus pictus TaxID=7653 RepID=UPI0030B9FAD4